MRRLLSLLVASAAGLPALSQATAYTYYGDDTKDYFGQAVRGLGDVDGDGTPDVAVGALGDDNSGYYAGALRVFSGATGAQLYHWDGDAPSHRLARSVAGPGDLNGDGRAEIVAGAANATYNGLNSGLVRVYDGLTGAILYDVLGSGPFDLLGWYVNGAGDVDLDGTPDIIAGARQYSGTGMPIGPGYARVLSGVDGSLIWEFTGDAVDDMFGFSVDGVGDVDGDGHADLIVGSPYNDQGGFEAGLARVFSGASGVQLYEYTGSSAGDRFGYNVAGAGDVDGDGRGDFLVGAPDGVAGPIAPGYAVLYSGADGSELFTYLGESDGDSMGQAVASAGDVDGDGLPEVLLGAHQDDDNGTGSGSAYVYRVDGTLLWEIVGSQAGELFGYALDSVGDLNSDGYSDLVVGAWNFSGAPAASNGQTRVVLSRVDHPTRYCTAKTSSQGCAPFIEASGVPSLSVADNFVLSGRDVLNQKTGLMFWGFGSVAVPFQGGTLCVQPPLKRTGTQFSGGNAPPTTDCSGTFAFAFDQAEMGQVPLAAGQDLFAQYWYRDPGFAAPQNTGLTDALTFAIVP